MNKESIPTTVNGFLSGWGKIHRTRSSAYDSCPGAWMAQTSRTTGT